MVAAELRIPFAQILVCWSSPTTKCVRRRVGRTCRSDEPRDYNGRISMNLTRRDLAAAGVFALSATPLIMPAMAATDDEGAVKRAVEALRKAILAQDKATLEMLAAEQLSYSHSDAHLEDKAKFINAIMTRKAVLKSLDFPDLTVAIVGNNAIVRHLWVSESELDGKVTNTKIGVRGGHAGAPPPLSPTRSGVARDAGLAEQRKTALPVARVPDPARRASSP